MSLHSVLLVVKAHHAGASAFAQQCVVWLAARGVSVNRLAVGATQEEYLQAATQCDMTLVLGGDGTMIEVCRRLMGTDLPLVGINFGKVGFLAELSPEQWEEPLSRILAGEVAIRKRLALYFELRRVGDALDVRHSGWAVNDLVLNRGAMARILSLDLNIGAHGEAAVRADGMIFSTPTGASGYGVSAGGALLHPDLDALMLTPICPFLHSFPPLIVPWNMSITAQVRNPEADPYVTIDGQEVFALAADELVCVRGVPGAFPVFNVYPDGYFRRLAARGFIGERN